MRRGWVWYQWIWSTISFGPYHSHSQTWLHHVKLTIMLGFVTSYNRLKNVELGIWYQSEAKLMNTFFFPFFLLQSFTICWGIFFFFPFLFNLYLINDEITSLVITNYFQLTSKPTCLTHVLHKFSEHQRSIKTLMI